MPDRTLKITLCYEGTAFVGWQRQASGRSVQGLLEETLSQIDGRAVAAVGAGRTDAGVHATGQVASVTLVSPVAAARLKRALNAMLPADVRVLTVDEAPRGFNARHDALTKTYCYRIVDDEVISPFEQRYAWHVAGRLNLSAMAAAARLLEGRHDFTAFRAAGSAAATSIRTVMSATFSEARPRDEILSMTSGRGRVVVFTITGDGFLRHMVRNVIGTLVEIGLRRRDVDSFAATLQAQDRARAGPTAPPLGLFLAHVEYAREQHGGLEAAPTA